MLLRPALALPAPTLGAAPWVELAESRQNWADRQLLELAGRFKVWTSFWPRLRLAAFARSVVAAGETLTTLDEAGLHQRAADLARRLRAGGPRGAGLARPDVIESFALVREVCGRQLGKRHYPAQLMGGRVMLEGGFAEMQTGEGKTLTALLPAVTMALAGVPVHVITVNEYLAARDAATLEPVYAFFGLSVGRVLPDQQPPERARAYRCDVAYCVNKDLSFDYLRDRIEVLAGRLGPRAAVSALFDARRLGGIKKGVMRGLWFAIIDEADSVFIDEARTPLIITQPSIGAGDEARFDAALDLAARMEEGTHYLVRQRERHAVLTEAGRKALGAVADRRLPAAAIERERLLEQALTARHGYVRDRHYIVDDGKVQIVDEYTGRVMPDRSWDGGLHQLIERKEGLALTAGRDTTARITYQRIFRRYLRLGGMSGTLTETAGELKSVLGVDVVRIPTHRRVLRRSLGVRLHKRGADRDAAVIEAARRETAQGRAVLIGTRSVSASERLAALLADAGVPHTVLNAKQDVEEAEVIAQAGHGGRITVATNMAGRGTDIELEPGVRQAGGLHVILTEFHDSTRIDRQLFGRAGRQGDPGSYECLVSLEDELFVSHAPRLTHWLRRRGADSLPAWMAVILRRTSQRAAERHHAEIRRHTQAQERETDRLLAFAGRPE